MAYTTAEGRRQILMDLAAAADELAAGVAALTEAYEELDDESADRLEASLFRPAQHAFGAARRTAAEFVARHRLDPVGGATANRPLPRTAAGAIAAASESLQAADATLGELQDSMLPVEVGDTELRAGISQIRALIGPLPARAAELLRTLGR